MRQLTDELGKSAKSLSEKDSDNAIINLSKYYEMHNGYTYLLLKIQEQLNQAMDKNNMPGEGENLNSLAEMQRQLNEQVKRMMGQVKDGKLSPQQKQYLNEMAKRQADIAKRLGNFREGNSESAKKMKQALEAIQREMEEVARELRTAKLNENLIDKQGKILKRMLDSERGLQSEERDDRRRGEQARVFRFGENEEIKKRFNEYLKNQKRFEQKKIDSLPEYYKILIKEYFDTLRNLINQ
jgi:small-conductance mechanosensitive channel